MLIELRSFIDIIMFFSSFEVNVLCVDGKVMTFVLYNILIKFPEIVKDWNATDSNRFEGVILLSMLNKLNENLVNCFPFTSAIISRICGA